MNAEFRTDPTFRLKVPSAVDSVDPNILDPLAAWVDGEDYDKAAQGLADRIRRNFTQFVAHVHEGVPLAGPLGIFDA